MHSRDELIQAEILDTLCDDYEDLTMIARHVGHYRADLTVSLVEILRHLATLIEMNLVDAYVLSRIPEDQTPAFTIAPPDLDYNNQSVYFYLSPTGKQKQWDLPDSMFPGRDTHSETCEACLRHRAAKAAKREPGAWRGKVWMSPDFDEADQEIEAMFNEGPIEPPA